jgi:hypothetical protein
MFSAGINRYKKLVTPLYVLLCASLAIEAGIFIAILVLKVPRGVNAEVVARAMIPVLGVTGFVGASRKWTLRLPYKTRYGQTFYPLQRGWANRLIAEMVMGVCFVIVGVVANC